MSLEGDMGRNDIIHADAMRADEERARIREANAAERERCGARCCRVLAAVLPDFMCEFCGGPIADTTGTACPQTHAKPYLDQHDRLACPPCHDRNSMPG